MFENLTNKLQDLFRRLRGRGRLSEGDVTETLKELRLVLLEADVNYKVVKEFTDKIKERAVGQEVMQSLTPGQQVIKIVNEELVSLLGAEVSKLNIAAKPPTTIMLIGLHGCGKTTTAGKLAQFLKHKGHKPLLVATDVYRPAAIKQLEVVGSQAGVAVFPTDSSKKPLQIAQSAKEYAQKNGYDVLIIDTAGRLHIDEEMMQELVEMRHSIVPEEILLVLDSMTGQDAVNVGKEFADKLGLNGFILTKLDSDARGGAALSIKAVTGKPIKFVGTGEKLDALEPFYPDRMASRILGMGDVLSLIEKAEAALDERKMKELERKIRKSELNLEDYLDQLQQVKKMGALDQILSLIPGISKFIRPGQHIEMDERRLKRVEAIIRSMTKEERRYPSILDASRKQRIARGSGTTVQEVNLLLKQFQQMKQMAKQLKDFGL